MGRSEGVRKTTQKRGTAGKGRKAKTRAPAAAVTPADQGRETDASPAVLLGDDESQAEETSARITLPPSGLASDILAREEAQAIEPAPEQEAVEPVGRPEGLAFLMAPAREEKKPVEDQTEHEFSVFLMIARRP